MLWGRCGHPRTPVCSRPAALQRLRGWEDVDREMEEIRQEDEAEKAAGFISVVKLFQMRSLRWQLISVIILMGGQQLSGVNAVRGGPGGGGCGQGQPRTGAQLWPGRAHQPPWSPSRSTTTQTRST